MRIFINHVDTYTGYALCGALRRFNGITNRMFGTVKGSRDNEDEESPPATQGDAEWEKEQNRLRVPSSIRRLISKRNPQQLLKTLLSCSLVVYDLHTTDPDEIEDVIKKLRRTTIEKPTVFVLVSSVMVWAKTKQEFVEHDPEEDAPEADNDEESSARGAQPGEEQNQGIGARPADEAHDEESDTESDDSDSVDTADKNATGDAGAEEEDEPLPERFKGTQSISRHRKHSKSTPPCERLLKPRLLRGTDLERRIPAQRYGKWKTIETLVMALGSKENLTTYVVAAGAMYGHGEGPFYPAFKAAWLGLQSHKFISPGNNFVPTVHVRDLASLVRRLAAGASEEAYHLAVDASRVTQFALIQTIASRVGPPHAVQEATQEDAVLVENADLLTVDLRMEPTAEMTAPDFPWWCQQGLPANIQKVAAEFCKWRKLRQVKILVAGPPGSGKSLLTSLLAAKLNTPAIRTQDIVEESKVKDDDLGSMLREKWDQLVEEQKKKKKASASASGGSGAINATRRVRFDTETMTKIYNAKLSENVCRYRGFVLDGYPRTYQEAEALFLRPKKQEKERGESEAYAGAASRGDAEQGSEEDEGAPPPQMEFDPLKAPDYVIVLRSSDAQCEERMMNVPQHQVIPGHSDREGFFRRLAQHKQANENEHGEPSLADFFQERRCEVLTLDVDGKSAADILECARLFIEKDGRFFNFLKSERQSILEKEQELLRQRQEEEAKSREAEELARAEEKRRMDERRKRDADRLQKIAEHERNVLMARSIPLRRYLMQAVVPTLSEGLLQVCRVMPEDPVDFLAEFLMAEAHKATNSSSDF
ncbi:Dpy-30 motif protein [Besnoitia besnoiti]|uniref:Dpy-30 motif protein n=1 Tax=Besnoitia besnoiti TaxID=94643 RepID=A0A2A9MJK6_BESBE|nr:Dpy-30 motif protein [Besnoitia besnoiti]PFH38728.1 Dpy-30 motif protein [Besnoitia besnoiti]